MISQLIEQLVESDPMDVFKPHTRDTLGDDKYDAVQKTIRLEAFRKKIVWFGRRHTAHYWEIRDALIELADKKGFVKYVEKEGTTHIVFQDRVHTPFTPTNIALYLREKGVSEKEIFDAMRNV